MAWRCWHWITRGSGWVAGLGLVWGGNPGQPWPAVDALARALPTEAEVGGPREDRFVGMFYFLWHAAHQGRSPHWDGPYDIARILERDSGALTNAASRYWGPIGMYHYWAEPLYGYYHSADPWVLRRHAMQLADAGVDTLVFDTTNAEIYREVYRSLCEVYARMRRAGERTPQIAFMVNTRAGETARRIYEDLYRPGDYEELWFRWRGKPLLVCDPAEADETLRAFFTLRRAHWPFSLTNTPLAWHWEATFPQPYGYVEDPGVPEQLTVSVAQNLRRRDGKVTNMSAGDARGRSFHRGAMETGVRAVDHGYNFQEQWTRAFELQPPFVMVTGWNEWIAGRWGTSDGPLVFVDQFDQENSRDIEPARVGHRDNYYWQLVANVRRFKGVPSLPRASEPVTWPTGGDWSDWAEVGPEFRDHAGETEARDHDGVAGLRYVNRSGRNDLELAKVARDSESLYFYIRSRETLSPRSGANWMWLFLDADGDAGTGWEGFDFVVNRAREAAGRCWLERNTGDWTWQRVAAVPQRVGERELQITIPRAALGLRPGQTAVRLDFQWADNLQRPGDILDFYASGDVAPEGRFRFRYEAP